jgi:hypothetical protein
VDHREHPDGHDLSGRRLAVDAVAMMSLMMVVQMGVVRIRVAKSVVAAVVGVLVGGIRSVVPRNGDSTRQRRRLPLQRGGGQRRGVQRLDLRSTTHRAFYHCSRCYH